MQGVCQVGEATPPRPDWDDIILYIPHNKNFAL